MDESAQLRIGELARRTGVATDLLRAWERRYGLLTPTRTSGGYRLYSTDDVRRVGRMRELLADGLSAAEAARATLVSPAAASAPAAPAAAGAELRAALVGLDDAAAHAAFDRLLAEFSVDSVLENVVLPVLRELGEGRAGSRQGSGLGLSLVRQIARRHGGEARCADRRGRGSCLVIALPAAQHK